MASKQSRAVQAQLGQGLFVEPGRLARLIEQSVQAAPHAQFQEHLGAAPCERTAAWQNYRTKTGGQD